MHRRVANQQLVLQVTPFIRKLPRTDPDRLHRADRPDLGAIERVTATRGLGLDRREIGVDGQQRMRVPAKALKLWMMGVAARLAAQHGLGKQGLTPKRDQPFGVQVFGVQ